MTQGHKKLLLAFLFLIAFSLVVQFANLRSNPPGFFIDESSIAYNAHLISTTGHDEHGEAFPLFFRAFGEFKNPVYIYLLAAVFRVTGPSMLVARSLSAFSGFVVVLLLGLLATQISRRRTVGLLFGVLCLLTPWLFELSRLVMEVAIYPLLLVLFLMVVWKASEKLTWGAGQICALAVTLALLTYTYSIGRLLAPMLALGLFLFVTRRRLLAIVLTCAAYSLTWIPILLYGRTHPNALTGRFRAITYLSPEVSWPRIARMFARHFFNNVNPWRLFVSESSKVSEIVHIPGWPALLTVTAILIIISVVVLIRTHGLNAWWLYVGYGLLLSVIPASLTINDFHMLRLAAVPVFLLLLTVPAFEWLVTSNLRLKRIVLVLMMMVIATQGLLFQWKYHESAKSAQRLHTFDADYPAKILPAALANAGSQPIYLIDNKARPGYIQAYWYATLQGIPISRFVSPDLDKAPPKGAIVITTEIPCSDCRVLAASDPYSTYVAAEPPPEAKPLPEGGMTAEVLVSNPPGNVEPGEQLTLEVKIKNLSQYVWPGARFGSTYSVSVGNHWLDENGNVIVHDDGRAPLSQDLNPNNEVVLLLTINAPSREGQYVLEIDLLQEGVSWFGLKGSRTWRGHVKVID